MDFLSVACGHASVEKKSSLLVRRRAGIFFLGEMNLFHPFRSSIVRERPDTAATGKTKGELNIRRFGGEEENNDEHGKQNTDAMPLNILS